VRHQFFRTKNALKMRLPMTILIQGVKLMMENSCQYKLILCSPHKISEAGERDLLYNFAPGERSIPVSVFLEQDSEELAFPGIFCGQRRPINNDRKVKVTYGDIVKSVLRNCDRRAAINVENIFFQNKKNSNEDIDRSMPTCLA
jgi:hypothetical protein